MSDVTKAERPSGPKHRILPDVFQRLRARVGGWYQRIAKFFWPLTDITTRFFVALAFLRSGIVKASDWEGALILAEVEYSVSWMTPETAAVTGLAIELVAPVLFLLGIATRPAAFAMAALTIVSQIEYLPTTTNIFLVGILIWYCISGPGPISLDRWYFNQISNRTNALIRSLFAAGSWLREQVAPYLMLAARIWLALAMLAYVDIFQPSVGFATWLPSSVFFGFPTWVAIPIAALLILGLGASVVYYLLFLSIGYFMVATAHPNVTFYPLLFLGIYEARGAGAYSLDRAIKARRKQPEKGAIG